MAGSICMGLVTGWAGGFFAPGRGATAWRLICWLPALLLATILAGRAEAAAMAPAIAAGLAAHLLLKRGVARIVLPQGAGAGPAWRSGAPSVSGW